MAAPFSGMKSNRMSFKMCLMGHLTRIVISSIAVHLYILILVDLDDVANYITLVHIFYSISQLLISRIFDQINKGQNSYEWPSVQSEV